MTHPDDTTATIERDLHAVDDALATGAAAHDDPLARELQELALALRADAPEPDPVFVERLHGTVAGGFPNARRALTLTRFLPAMAAAATVVAIGVVLASAAATTPEVEAAAGPPSLPSPLRKAPPAPRRTSAPASPPRAGTARSSARSR